MPTPSDQSTAQRESPTRGVPIKKSAIAHGIACVQGSRCDPTCLVAKRSFAHTQGSEEEGRRTDRGDPSSTRRDCHPLAPPPVDRRSFGTGGRDRAGGFVARTTRNAGGGVGAAAGRGGYGAKGAVNMASAAIRAGAVASWRALRWALPPQ